MRFVWLKKFTLLALLLWFASCVRQSEPSLSYYQGPMRNGPSVTAGPTVPVPRFTIRIVLTQVAQQKLANAGETISGSIDFDGDGTPLPNEHTAPMRDVILGSYEFEVREGGEVNVTEAVISKEAYDRLSDKNFHFTINATSGRRAFQNNILDGGYAIGRLTDLNPEKPIEIKCDLL